MKFYGCKTRFLIPQQEVAVTRMNTITSVRSVSSNHLMILQHFEQLTLKEKEFGYR